MNIVELLKNAIEKKASDLHLTVGVPPVIRVNGQMNYLNNEIMFAEDTLSAVKQILDEKQFAYVDEVGEIDLSYSIESISRFRLNIYKQRNTYALVARSIPYKIPQLEELGLPSVISELTNISKGLILVTGPTGSGKSTTLAAMINKINRERSEHIITLEDPIEFLHKHDKSIVNQREIGYDSKTFTTALRASLRQDPDIILVGEMRDLDTISIAITAAETGHLVLSTLHTIGAAKTIDRIIDVFPPYQQSQIRVQLSTVLQAVVSQQLIPRIDNKGRAVAIETMIVTPAIRNIIREGKSHQIISNIQTGAKYGMQSMDASIQSLLRNRIISQEEALQYAVDPENLLRMNQI